MNNKALACLGIVAYVLTILTSITNPEGRQIAPSALINVSIVATSIFVVWAPIRLWTEARGVSLLLAISAGMSVLCGIAQPIWDPGDGSILTVITNIVIVMGYVAYFGAIMKLFRTNRLNDACLASR